MKYSLVTKERDLTMDEIQSVTKERDLKCWQYFLKVFTNECKQHNLYCINIQIQCHCVPCTSVQVRSYAYYHFPAFCCPARIFAARLWGLLPLGSLLTGIMCRLAELVLGFEVQCMEGRPFGAADFPLDPYFLLSSLSADNLQVGFIYTFGQAIVNPRTVESQPFRTFYACTPLDVSSPVCHPSSPCCFNSQNFPPSDAILNSHHHQIPYRGKLSREKTFTNFTVLWLFAKVYSVKFGVSFGAAQVSNLQKFFYAKIVFFTNSRKFSPSKVSRYTVVTNWTVSAVQ